MLYGLGSWKFLALWLPRLVAKAFQLPAGGYEFLIFPLQVPLLLDDARDLIAHELRELIAVYGGAGRDGSQEAQLSERFFQ